MLMDYCFGFFLTLALFIIFYKFKNNKFLKKVPIILSVGILIILILKIFKIDYKTYYHSASIFSFLIAPATIALAYPMYKNSDILVKNKRIIYSTILIASIGAIISTVLCAQFFHAQEKVILSLIPKSTTMPIALEITKTLNGYSEITATVVALTGVFGGIFGHSILKFLKVKNDIAIGLALGSASHVIGTAACADKNKPRQTAASTIALILVGLTTVIIVQILKAYFSAPAPEITSVNSWVIFAWRALLYSTVNVVIISWALFVAALIAVILEANSLAWASINDW